MTLIVKSIILCSFIGEVFTANNGYCNPGVSTTEVCCLDSLFQTCKSCPGTSNCVGMCNYDHPQCGDAENCQSALSQKTPSQGTTYTLSQGSGTVDLYSGSTYLNFFDHSDTSECPIIECKYYMKTTGYCNESPTISGSFNSDYGLQVDTSSTGTITTACVKCRTYGTDYYSYYITSTEFSITVGAASTCPSDVETASASVISATSSTTLSYTIDGSEPSSTLSKYTGTSGCTVSGYALYASKSDSSVHSSVAVDDSGSSLKIYVSSSSAYSTAASYTFYIKVLINSGSSSTWYQASDGSEQFTLAVSLDCSSVVLTEGSTHSPSSHVALSSSAAFDLNLFTPSFTGCGTITYDLSSSNSAVIAPSGITTPTVTSSSVTVSASDYSVAGKYEFYLRASLGAVDAYSSQKTFIVGCPTSSGLTATIGSYPSGYSDTQQVVEGSASLTKFILPTLTSSSSTICPISAQVSSTTGSVTTIPTLGSPTYNSGTSQWEITPTSLSTETAYVFYVKVTNVADTLWTSQLTLNVGCYISGVTITIGSYSGSFTDTQSVPAGDASLAFFTLPSFSTPNVACPVTLKTSSSTGTVATMSSLNDPVYENSEWVVKPTNINLAQDYIFYVQATSKDDEQWTAQLTLKVGCPLPLSSLSFVDAVSPTSVSVDFQAGSDVTVFTFTNPSSGSSSCPILSNSITNLENNGVASTTAVFFSSGCTQPCLTIKSSSLLSGGPFTFNVVSAVSATVSHTSPLITINLVCGPSTTITNPIAAATHNFARLQPGGAALSFPYSSCSVPGCCSLTYFISSASGSIIGVTGMAANPTDVSTGLEVTIDVTTAQTFDFYIIAQNAQNVKTASGKITAVVATDCSIFPVTASTASASATETSAAAANSLVTVSYEKQSDNSYIASLSANVGAVTSYFIDISERFSTPQTFCPISNYQISSVTKDTQQVTDFSQLFSIDTAGQLTIKDFTTAAEYAVAVQVFNGGWSVDISVLSLAITATTSPLPSVAPSFVTPVLEAKNVTMKAGSETTLTVALPEVFDMNQDSITLTVEQLESFMTLNTATNAIEVDLSKVEASATYSVKVILTDSTGLSKSYTQEIFVNVEKEATENTSEKPSLPTSLPGVGIIIGGQPEEEKPSSTQEEAPPETLELGAKIQSIDALGVVTIKFNASLHGFNLSALNDQTADIYVDPVRGRTFADGALNLSSWKTIELSDSQLLTLKLNFTNPLEVSPLEVQDSLVVHLSEDARSLFYAPELGKSLNHEFMTLRRKIRKQMPDTEFTKSFQASAEQAEASLLWIIIIVFILNHLLSGGMIYMLLLVRYLQIVLHLPIMAIILPANMAALFSTILPVATFDVLDPEWTTQLVFQFDEPAQDQLQDSMLDQMVDLGYETHNSLLNLGSLAIFTFIYLLRVIVYFSLCFVSLFKPKAKEKASAMAKTLFFGEILSILIEAYFEFLISGYLQLKAPLTTTDGEYTSIIIGVLGLFLILIFMPLGFFKVLAQPLQVLDSDEFKQKWGALYEGIRTANKWQVAYYFFFASRRVVYVGLAIFLRATPQLQVTGLMFLNLFQMGYIGQFLPQEVRRLNRIELYLEWSALTVILSLVWFTDWLPNEETKYAYAWMPISLIVLSIMVCMCFVLYFGIKSLYLTGIKAKRIMAHKLRMVRSDGALNGEDSPGDLTHPLTSLSLKPVFAAPLSEGDEIKISKLISNSSSFKQKKRKPSVIFSNRANIGRPPKISIHPSQNLSKIKEKAAEQDPADKPIQASKTSLGKKKGGGSKATLPSRDFKYQRSVGSVDFEALLFGGLPMDAISSETKREGASPTKKSASGKPRFSSFMKGQRPKLMDSQKLKAAPPKNGLFIRRRGQAQQQGSDAKDNSPNQDLFTVSSTLQAKHLS